MLLHALGKPKGYAFVTFESGDAASTAIRAMNGSSYQGRELTVSIATARGSGGRTPSVIIDDSWKTVPTASSRSATKQLECKPPGTKGSKDGSGKQKKTWDHWAGPTVKADV